LRLQLCRKLGKAAREARLEAGLTQADVAERIDVATEVYGRLERGLMLPSVLTFWRLCLVLRLPADRLLGFASRKGTPGGSRLPAERDSAQVRRLMRSVRKLNGSQLRALSSMVAALQRGV
jgi:transcriptional regulator with XRE-family HTH domain